MSLWPGYSDIKKLEDKKLVERKKKTGNDKNILLSITKKGIDLKEKAKQVPKELEKCVAISEDDRNTLKEMLNRIIKREKKFSLKKILSIIFVIVILISALFF